MNDLAFSVPVADAPVGEPRTNMYKGTCVQCGESVVPQHGYVFKTKAGKWLTCCKSKLCYGALFGSDAADEVGRRYIAEDGAMHGVSDVGSRALVKAIAEFDWERKKWIALTGRGDRDLVLEVAERLDVEVPESWRNEGVGSSVEERVHRAVESGARDYQVTGVAWLAQHDTACLADDMGLGKSFQILHALPDNEGLLIVCPAVVKGAWLLEIEKWCAARFDNVHVCKGRGSFRWPKHARECVIINYDILPPQKTEVDTIRKALAEKQREKTALALKSALTVCTTPPGQPARLEPLGLSVAEQKTLTNLEKSIQQLAAKIEKQAPCGTPPCAVTLVADEAHALKNNKAKRTARFRAMAKKCSHVWGATGTPVEARPQELWGVLTSLQCNPLSWNAFQEGFSAYDGKYGMKFQRDADGAIIVQPGVTERLRRTMLRRVKSEVAKELPPKIYTEHPVAITRALVKQLDEIAGTWVDYLLDSELPPFEAMAAVRRVLADACTAEAIKLVEQYEEQAAPVVVFSAHRAPILALGSRKGWGMIIGGMSAEKRTATIADFQAGKLLGLACTIRAAGVGVTLTHASSELFIDLDWSPSSNLQAEDRCHRLGQAAQSVDIVRMVPDHVLTRHIAALLHAKQVFVERTLHGVAGFDPSSAEALTDEDASAWQKRVTEHQSARAKAADCRRRRELTKLASGSKKLTPAQAEERATLRLAARGARPLLEKCTECAGLGVVCYDLDAGDEECPTCHGTCVLEPLLPVRAIQAAFSYMLSVCDGAHEKDDVGFNAPDAAISRWVAPAVFAGSPAGLTCAYTLLRHYPRQLQAQWGELFE